MKLFAFVPALLAVAAFAAPVLDAPAPAHAHALAARDPEPRAACALPAALEHIDILITTCDHSGPNVNGNIATIRAALTSACGCVVPGSTVDATIISNLVGRIILHAAVLLDQLEETNNRELIGAGEGLVGAVGNLLGSLCVVKNVDKIFWNLVQIKLVGNTTLAKLLCQVVTTILQLSNGLLQSLGLGDIGFRIMALLRPLNLDVGAALGL